MKEKGQPGETANLATVDKEKVLNLLQELWDKTGVGVKNTEDEDIAYGKAQAVESFLFDSGILTKEDLVNIIPWRRSKE